MKILVTGFDPFGEEKINPSYEVIKILPDKILGEEIIKIEIPTVTKTALKKIINLIEEKNPDIVISLGQAGGRMGVTPELIGINNINFPIEDNEGNKINNKKVVDSGDDGLFTTLPVEEIVMEMKKSGIPSYLSYTAGTFVCNEVMYGTLEYIKKNKLNIKSGFIHIPFIYEQILNKTNVFAMPLDIIGKGIEKSIEVTINQIKRSKG